MTIREEKKLCIAILKDNFELFCKIIEELPEDKLSRDEFIDLISTIDSTMLDKLTKILGQKEENIVNQLQKAVGHPGLLTVVYAELGLIAKQEKEGGKDDN